jgi:LacI family transcriptional regulator
VALEVMSVLKTHGIAIPDKVGLMGFDNLDELKYITPRLTTVASPIKKIGEQAFDYLLETIKGECIDSRVLEHRIVEGETV